MSTISVAVRKLPHGQDLDLPVRATAHAAGVDLRAAVADDLIIPPGNQALVPAGISIALPVGYEAQVRPRSGLAAKHGVTVLNAPGTIDADYRGEVMVILINHGARPFRVSRGMRIAQMVIAPIAAAAWEECTRLPATARGDDGFGSTGN
ncbi:MAG TPA: dUTP diphosphatase [Alphaproteobacteria bacterium]|nr:dUTP diphosphatase [Alphaproteobacteria bacterium]